MWITADTMFFTDTFSYDDRLVISFNYKDGTKSMSLSDLQSSDLDVPGVPENDPNASSIQGMFGSFFM